MFWDFDNQIKTLQGGRVMGCGNEVTPEDIEAIQKAAQGKNSGFDESILTPEEKEEFNRGLQQKSEELEEQVQKMREVGGENSVNNVIIEKYEGGEVDEEQAKELAEEIRESDPNDALLILRDEAPSSFFTPGFNDSGEKVEFFQEDEKDPNVIKATEEWPEIKVYSPVQPTIENLGNLLAGRNPYNPWDDKVTWHHIEQQKDNIGVVTVKSHVKHDSSVMHEKGKRLGDENRREWRKIKPKIMKEIARNYLGKFAENDKIISTLLDKAREFEEGKE